MKNRFVNLVLERDVGASWPDFEISEWRIAVNQRGYKRLVESFSPMKHSFEHRRLGCFEMTAATVWPFGRRGQLAEPPTAVVDWEMRGGIHILSFSKQPAPDKIARFPVGTVWFVSFHSFEPFVNKLATRSAARSLRLASLLAAAIRVSWAH
jgi:hypothetical protein